MDDKKLEKGNALKQIIAELDRVNQHWQVDSIRLAIVNSTGVKLLLTLDKYPNIKEKLEEIIETEKQVYKQQFEAL